MDSNSPLWIFGVAAAVGCVTVLFGWLFFRRPQSRIDSEAYAFGRAAETVTDHMRRLEAENADLRAKLAKTGVKP